MSRRKSFLWQHLFCDTVPVREFIRVHGADAYQRLKKVPGAVLHYGHRKGIRRVAIEDHLWLLP